MERHKVRSVAWELCPAGHQLEAASTPPEIPSLVCGLWWAQRAPKRKQHDLGIPGKSPVHVRNNKVPFRRGTCLILSKMWDSCVLWGDRTEVYRQDARKTGLV